MYVWFLPKRIQRSGDLTEFSHACMTALFRSKKTDDLSGIVRRYDKISTIYRDVGSYLKLVGQVVMWGAQPAPTG